MRASQRHTVTAQAVGRFDRNSTASASNPFPLLYRSDQFDLPGIYRSEATFESYLKDPGRALGLILAVDMLLLIGVVVVLTGLAFVALGRHWGPIALMGAILLALALISRNLVVEYLDEPSATADAGKVASKGSGSMTNGPRKELLGKRPPRLLTGIHL